MRDIKSAKSEIDTAETAAMLRQPMRNCNASLRNRDPPQTLHGL